MPTDKRARQKALRAEKQAQMQRAKKRRQNIRRGISLLVLAAAVVLVVVLVTLPSSPKKKSAAGATTTTSTSSTTTTTVAIPSTTFAPPTTQPLTASAVAPTCPSASETTRVVWFTKAPPDCIGKHSVWDATFTTSVGSFVVTMDAAKSYAAVNNFVFLAKWNYYNGTFFHRVIPGFVVQGGDPAGTGTGGPHGYPGYTFTGNTPPAACKTKPTTAGCYVPGDLAMANSTGPSSNASQFFVVLPGGQTTLNGEPNYTNFGVVTSGMPVVEKIGSYGSSSGTPALKVYLLKVAVTQVKS